MAKKQGKKVYELMNYENVYNNANHKLLIEYVGAKEISKTPTYLQPYPNVTKYVDFFAYLDKYSDTFNSNFTQKNVYGRVDPIVNYENTTRQISLSFKIPAVDLFQARMNLNKLSKLSSFLYPVYQKSNDIDTHHIKQPPILRLKFGNIIMDQKTGGGLYGYINGSITYDWDLESGIFIAADNKMETVEYEESNQESRWLDYMNETREGRTRYYPKIVNLSITFSVLHNHLVGHPSNETDTSFNESAKQFYDIYGFTYHVPMHRGILDSNDSESDRDRSMTADETYREDSMIVKDGDFFDFNSDSSVFLQARSYENNPVLMDAIQNTVQKYFAPNHGNDAVKKEKKKNMRKK
jgi:hypothetical protein